MKTYALTLLGLWIAGTGLPFWSDRAFYWAGETVDHPTMHLIGIGFAVVGIVVAYCAGRWAGRQQPSPAG